jgi:hypothetical protein
MRLGKQFAKVFVSGATFSQDWQNTPILHAQLATNNWPYILFASGNRESLRAINAIAVQQSQRRHLQFRGPFRKLFGKGSSA